ncbi:MAG: DUF4350 domain-containing protein [Armatimonadota bacterium]|nr:DUF4350 domain-containing protein [Armatimonadota bacterium]
MSDRARTVLLVVSAVVVLVVAGVLARRATYFDRTRDHSSLRTNPWGTKAWRELLAAAGVPGETWGVPLTELSREVDMLVVLDPTIPVTDGEREALLQWVRDGGRLVLAPGERGVPGRRSGSAMIAIEELLLALGLSERRGVSAQQELARPARHGDLTADVHSVLVPTGRRLELAPLLAQADVSQPEIVLSDTHGTAAAVTRVGEGNAIVLCEAEMLSNAVLSKADNVVFAANLAFAGGAPNAVYFDEYHHGFFASRGVFAGPQVDERPFWYSVVAVLFVAAVYALGRAKRLGAPAAGPDDPRRPAAEYVRAFARVYARARASDAAAGMLLQGLRRRLARAAGVPASAPDEALLAGLTRIGVPRDTVADLLSGLQRARAETPGERELLALAREVATCERMVGHG